MGFEIRSFSFAPSPVRAGGAQAPAQTSSDRNTSAVQGDQATFSTKGKVGDSPDYPTVGQYVTQQFDQKVNDTVKGLHLVAEAVPPVLIGEIAAIHARHKEEALKEIWNLPMDPQGKWKIKAKEIMQVQEKAADVEVSQLPMVQAAHQVAAGIDHTVQSVGQGFSWLGGQISTGYGTAVTSIDHGLHSAGQAVSKAANYAVDGFVSTGVAVGKGIEHAGIAIQNGSVAAGKAIRDAGHTLSVDANQAYESTVSGIHWVGTQVAEAPKAAARGVLHGIDGVGQDLQKFSVWALGGLGN